MLSPDQTPRSASELFDAEAAAQELDALAATHAGRAKDLQSAVAQYMKGELTRGREKAEQLLLKERQGRRCAERLCAMQDEIIRVLFEFAGKHLYPSDNPSEAERMAVIATGGYGRGLLAPGSDIDLLFVLPYKQTAWGESIAEAILYCLWDMGLKVGHATRSVDECIRQAKADMTIRTAILESRFLNGDRALFDELATRFDRNVVQGTGAEFVAAKLAEREERLRRAGQSRYLVEPNVKDGKGGLRDLHTLFWIGKYVYRAPSVEELVQHGVFDKDELKLFRRCEEFLWSVRCHMHFVTGRPEERLSFDIQREIAVRLGYTEHPGLRDVERFMKHYFLTAKNVGDLTAILCAALEANHTKSAPIIGRMMARLRPNTGRRSLAESDDFIVDNNRINIAKPDVFARDPVNLIRIFHLAQKHNLAFHPDAMRTATRSLDRINKDVREDPEANRLFFEILTSPHDIETVLRRMNEAGVLGTFVRAFGRVVAMMQFNMYHHYTVDEHLIRCMGVIAEIESGTNEEYGLANELVKKLTAAPARAAAHHAVPARHRQGARGRSFDRRRAGGAAVLPAHRPDHGGDRDRRLADREPPRHVHRCAIARSVGPQDHREFRGDRAVARPAQAVAGADHGRYPRGRAGRLERLEGAASAHALLRNRTGADRRILGGQSRAARGAGAGRVPRSHEGLAGRGTRQLYRAGIIPAYWLKVDLPRKIAQAHFLREAWNAGRTLATQVSFDAARGVTELTVIAPDHPRLLSIIAGACAAAGGNIVDAQIYTTTDGLALDTISLTREFEHDEDEGRRASRIADTIEKALRGEIKLPDVVARRAPPKARLKAFALEPEVNINNEWSNRYTVVEVTGLDRPGLLYELTATISKLSLNITSAHVATFGERVVDVFYVTDLLGAKIASPTRQAAIKRALLALFSRPGTEDAGKAAGARS